MSRYQKVPDQFFSPRRWRLQCKAWPMMVSKPFQASQKKTTGKKTWSSRSEGKSISTHTVTKSQCVLIYPPWNQHGPCWKSMVGRWISFWVSAHFQGHLLLVLGRVSFFFRIWQANTLDVATLTTWIHFPPGRVPHLKNTIVDTVDASEIRDQLTSWGRLVVEIPMILEGFIHVRWWISFIKSMKKLCPLYFDRNRLLYRLSSGNFVNACPDRFRSFWEKLKKINSSFCNKEQLSSTTFVYFHTHQISDIEFACSDTTILRMNINMHI